ncbi:DUF3047 domain-containing protein [Leptothrix discophora]|uniref:DUF3047 domain-containing protein n=1 Tax=Leptothrix discophora TaxID=89 RepID=A0ABT9G612_LEPDI|nr:DUF3047 domain-containing protein [Leptothrix discophora]MDP4301926.1 DUF3047 domain-containing protein [Leptothrix discophora]
MRPNRSDLSVPGLSRRSWLAVFAATLLAGCAVTPGSPGALGVPVTSGVSTPTDGAAWAAGFGPDWQGVPLPGKRHTNYSPASDAGRACVHAAADRSASMWRRKVHIAPAELGQLRFSWKVPGLIPEADLSDRDAEDAPVRIVLAFDGDHARLGMRDRMLFELAETLTGERPPYATLMYVWDNRAPVDSVIHAARTDRVRKLVLESGPSRLSRWLDYQRDVAADFRRLYGEEPGALIGVAIMTDADNTQSRSEAFYGPIRLTGADGRPLF